jgi:ApaG protein
MYRETTNDIEVSVHPFYVPEQSDPSADRFLFGYRVTITNHGKTEAQLLTRHWIVTDGHSHVEEVRGEGVVGLQPRLKPGETFEYTSACPLPTPTGNMRGTYHMQRADGRKLSVRIPLFFLRHPDTFH